jgi:GT2 family glycosyltransferase
MAEQGLAKTMDIPRTGAVIVHYKGIETTLKCIDDILRQTHFTAPLVIVDQGVEPDAHHQLKTAFPTIIVLTQTSNVGFPAAVRIGMAALRAGGARLAFIANPDIRLAPDTITSLIPHIIPDPVTDIADVGAVGPLLMDAHSPGTIWAAGGMVGPNIAAGNAQSGMPLSCLTLTSPQDVDYIPACAMLVSLDAWETVGGMDDGCFLYYEDVDFGLRLNRHKLRSVMVPSVIVHHQGSANTAELPLEREYYLLRNRLRTARRWQSGISFWLGAYIDCHRIVFSSRKRGEARAGILSRAVRDAISGIDGPFIS